MFRQTRENFSKNLGELLDMLNATRYDVYMNTTPTTDSTECTECTKCSAVVSSLAIFPGGICLDCYKLTPAAHAKLTSSGIVAMWGGPVRRRS